MQRLVLDSSWVSRHGIPILDLFSVATVADLRSNGVDVEYFCVYQGFSLSELLLRSGITNPETLAGHISTETMAAAY